MAIWDEIKASFRRGSVVTRLIYVNLAVFLIFRIIYVIFFLTGMKFPLIQIFEIPGSFMQLLRQPWSLITYMFLHFDFIHIIFNLLALFWFGRIFLSYYDQRQMLSLYFVGGLAGGLLYVLAYSLIPVFSRNGISYMLGASASIIAILMAAAFTEPNRKINLFLIGAVPLKYLALAMIIMYIIGISTSNAGGNIAHLGGVFAGWSFVYFIRRGKDITSWLSKIIDWIAGLFKPRKKIRIVHKQPPRDDYEYNRQRAADHDELNRILDKIAEQGYESLSKHEKETLFKHGK